MKIKDTEGKSTGEIKLPKQFEEFVNGDLIQRAVLALQSSRRQRYGVHPEAGKRASAKLSKRRRDYRGSYGHGISRVPRKILSRNGTRMNWVGAVAPGTVGGRKAHPPKAEKIWEKKINKKENEKAIRSALAASLDKDVVAKRGHKTPEDFPFIIDSNFEKLSKTKDAVKAFAALGLGKELERAGEKRIRAGIGKMRGRRYKKAKGPLVVVSQDCELIKSVRNIAGVNVVKINEITAEMLAPGCAPGRLALFTKSSIEKLEKEKLYM
jgi:large subunit ribosomal protein L4e